MLCTISFLALVGLGVFYAHKKTTKKSAGFGGASNPGGSTDTPSSTDTRPGHTAE